MTRFFILGEDGEPLPCHDYQAWEEWMVDHQLERTVAKTYPDGLLVETYFLGTDHNFLGSGPPVLWETLITGGDHHGYRERYVRREVALARHEQLVADLKSGAFSPYDQNSSPAVIEARKIIRERGKTRSERTDRPQAG